jgi:serine/threonine-protein kinase
MFHPRLTGFGHSEQLIMSDTAEHLRVIEGEQGDPLVGQTIDGRYRVEGVLGEGGMGLVYRSKHIVLGKPLAIKVLRPDVSRDEEIITRFRQEAQSASSIGNQHIIDISDFGTLPDGATYFVMEFLDGSDLTKVIENQQPIAPARVIHIAKQLCAALGAAHEIGIVHRDLKPDNIYLIKRGGDPDFVKVLDFGIAKVGGSSSKLTRAGQVFGTPHYMSPEQCSGSGVDHRTDIYAIGVILYEMVTGGVPFDADNLMGILTKHLYEEPQPPSALRADVPPELEQVILRCMSKSTEQRYQTMGELLDDLLRIEQGIAPMPMPPRMDPTGSFRHSAVPTPPAKSKLPLVLGGVALVLALGGGGVGYVLLSRSPEAPRAEVPTTPTPTAQQPPEAPVAEPVAEQAAAPAEEAAPAEPVVTKVRVVSEPAGAQVWLGETLLGNTPIEVPRPTGDETLALELRERGYQTQEFAISKLTVAEELSFSLVQESARRGSRVRRVSASRGAHAEPAAEPRRDTPRRSSPATEVLDPWAN